MSKKRLRDARRYGLGWIAPLPLERAAALAMLDEQHQEPMLFQQHESDHNSYSWGNISGHNVVIASLGSQYGKVSASTAAMSMLSSLPHIKCGLLVGIGAGTPSRHHDVRLGDVVVSKPSGKNNGIVQYDLHKARAGNRCELKGSLAPPVKSLLTAVAAIEASHSVEDPQLPTLLEKAAVKYPRWKSTTVYPGSELDRLFSSSYDHEDPEQDNCNVCRPTEEIVRFSRSDNAPIVHYGTIGSGDTLVKSAQERDTIVARIGSDCLCLEMEAAGVMDDFPCLVVRGICDYADTHKNDIWQPYAAAVAAAYAKELLSYARIDRLPEFISAKSTPEEDEKLSELLQQLYTCPYAERKDRNIRRVPGTCQWFTNHRIFKHWLNQPEGLLWVSADPGCGKSVLTRYLIDEVLPAQTRDRKATICYFFFKDDFQDQKRATDALSAMVRQILVQNRHLFLEETVVNAMGNTAKFPATFTDQWKLFVVLAEKHENGPIICVLDALDECQHQDCLDLVQHICALFAASGSKCNLKFLLTSRLEFHIRDAFYDTEALLPTIHLSGESQAEANLISKEIDIVINERVTRLCALRKLSKDCLTAMLKEIQRTPNRTYLWAHLVLSVLETAIGLTKESILSTIQTLPQSVEAAYDKILNRSQDKARTRILLNIVVSAFRPLTVAEMSIMLVLREDHMQKLNLEDAIEPAESFRSTIRDLCSLFVIVVDERVYLLHQTAREYLLASRGSVDLSQSNQAFESEHLESLALQRKGTWKGSISEQRAHYTIAQRCLWYIMNNIAFIESSSQHGDAETTQDQSPGGTQTTGSTLYKYCQDRWTKHVYASGESIDLSMINLIVAFCSNETLVRFYRQERFPNQRFGGPVDSEERPAITALVLASCFPLPAVVQMLLRSESGYHYSVYEKSMVLWHTVATKGRGTEFAEPNIEDTSVVNLLLDYGADANFQYQSLVYTSDSDADSVSSYEMSSAISYLLNFTEGSTPLHFTHHNKDIAINLLAHGANPNAVDTNGRSPLHYIVKYNETFLSASMEILIESGARPEVRDSRGLMPLQVILGRSHNYCSLENSRKLFDLLYSREMSINERDGDDNLLRHLIRHDCSSCVEAILDYHANIGINDYQGYNLLDESISPASMPKSKMPRSEMSMSKLPMVKMLLSRGVLPSDQTLQLAAFHGLDARHLELLLIAGAKADSAGHSGQTALMLVAGTDDGSTKIKLLIRYGADVSARDSKGRTALHQAALSSSIDDARVLLANGANANVCDEEGRTPLMLFLAEFDAATPRFAELLPNLPKLLSILLTPWTDPDVVDINGGTLQKYCERLLEYDVGIGRRLLNIVKGRKWSNDARKRWCQ